MELEIITALSSLGVGAIFGIVVFLIYRNHCQTTETRMADLIDRDIKTREDNTKALTELTTFLRMQNGKNRGQ